MTFLQSAVLGMVQGITEFLPVSSDGHLALFQLFLSVEPSLAFDVAVHVGTLAAMVLFFGKDFVLLAKGLFAADPSIRDLERRRLGYIVLASVPTAAIGFSLKSVVESSIVSLGAAGVGFLLTAGLLFGGERLARREGTPLAFTPWWHALVLGIAQGLAVWPGLSRSGATIAVALALGWKWEEAGRFSFMMAVPAVAGATLLSARDILVLPKGPVLTGVLVAFVAGLAALALLMRFLAARKLWPFAVYCAALGIISLIL
ncbi:MAG TPA: undecaprenyl-diphosphate phosphatase [Elusimicrobiota bacterium]|nr:undecaprenyl-diphosphate phosphatase [Elusimicrobiota bacterium]